MTSNIPFKGLKTHKLPFDVSSVSEVFHRVISQIFEGLHDPDIVMNDDLIWIVNDIELEKLWKFLIKIMEISEFLKLV